jgi:zinc finger protein ubi-d4
MNEPLYRESIKNAAEFNTRLSHERTQRLPFLDHITGVAQNHSNLWMDARQRLPGLREGQILTYPSKRWKKKRRQYLSFLQPRFNQAGMLRKEPILADELELPPAITSEVSTPTPGPSAVIIEDSKDSMSLSMSTTKEESKQQQQEWFYDDLDIPDAGEFDEPDADSDYDYEESYSKRKKKKPVGKPTRGRGSGAPGRRKITYDAVTDPEKPFACDICGARYKTRPGLTYHYTHSHKDKEDDDVDDDSSMGRGSPKPRDDGRRRMGSLAPPLLHPQQGGPPYLQPQQGSPQQQMPGLLMHMSGGGPQQMQHHSAPPPHTMASTTPPHLVPQQQPSQQHHPQQQPYPHHQQMGGMPPHGQMGSNNGGPPGGPQFQNPNQGQGPTPAPVSGQSQSVAGGQQPQPMASGQGTAFDERRKSEPPRAQPSNYCDFCLGDAAENKKSGVPEELVSCSDCGRSGHPTCLQFTNNMTISVKKYRWQCIECKCCSLCGTSDNDDQLLFCDDCDRGYHMYCLQPPLSAPPEGSWSCALCIAEFHSGK